MKNLEQLTLLLKEIIDTQEKSLRLELIKAFQEIVWKREYDASSKTQDLLSDLANDLDYFEADEAKRAEDPTFFGEDRLVREIETALLQLQDSN